ncbi:MAG: peptidoglycan-associated lipoprotein Pal [Thermodesulfobacteriota bacterium]
MKETRINMLSAAAVGLCLVLFAGGCAKKEVAADTATMAPAATQPSREAKMEQGEPIVTPPRTAASQFSEGRTSAPMLPVYFDFDKFNIRDDQKERMATNTRFLKDSPNVKIRVEGNCDERGTNEYNMALGERRANSAKKYLVNMGVAANRVDTLSLGEERPLLMGHDEMSWAQNRRDDFVIER